MNYKHNQFLILLISFFLLTTGVKSQNCYIQKDDAGGFNTAPFSAELETAACDLKETLPDSFRSAFKVYDFGFYVHNESMNGGMTTIWNQVLGEIENDPQSDFYLVLGRESSSKGINNRIRVKLKLPTFPPFDCLTQEKRNSIEKYVESVANINLSVEYYIAEKKAMESLKYYIGKVINCECDGIRKTDCDENLDFETIDAELLGLKFRKKQIETVRNSNWVSGTQGIFDYAGKTVRIDGIEYDIADQISEGKAIIEASVQVLPDTTVSTSISGEVYILDNESFKNNQWENAIARSNVLDYVEYWVILTNRRGEVFLYSRFTIGSFGTEDPTLKKRENTGSKTITVSPWGLALKALGNAAVDAIIQAVIVRITDPKVKDMKSAWSEVSYLGAAWEGISSLLPWKKDLSVALIRTAVSAFVVVFEKANTEPDYDVPDGIQDFIVGCASSWVIQIFSHPRVADKIGYGNFARLAFRNGLDRIYFSNNGISPILKRVIFHASKLFDDVYYGVVRSEKYIDQRSFIGGVNKIDLMGGKKTQIGHSFVNVDFSNKIEEGIYGDATKLSKYIAVNSVDEIVCNNPYLGAGFKAEDYIKEVAEVIKQGKKVYINGTINNPFYNRVTQALVSQFGFVIETFQAPLLQRFANLKFFRTDGSVIDSIFMRSTVLRKL